jgi:FhuF-like iron-sulfur protein
VRVGHDRRVNPFFAVETHPVGAAPRAPWRVMRELVDDPAVLADRVHAVRTRLAAGRSVDAVEQRVAASVTHLGLVARLVSPALAAALTDSAVPDLDLRHTWWQPVLGGAFPLSVADTTASLDQLLNGPVRTLVAATRPFSVSDQILWGNVASALYGAAAMIGGRANVDQLMDRPPLRDTGTTVDGRFRRRSCCLIYRAAPGRDGPVCGDCVLRPSS